MAGTAGTLHATEHPLVQHKLTLLGQRATSAPAFRQLLREVIPVDPTPATGHSASAATDRPKQAAGAAHILLLRLLAAPEGLATLRAGRRAARAVRRHLSRPDSRRPQAV